MSEILQRFPSEDFEAVAIQPFRFEADRQQTAMRELGELVLLQLIRGKFLADSISIEISPRPRQSFDLDLF